MTRSLLVAATSIALGFLGVYVVGREALLDAAAYRPARLDPALVALALSCLFTLWFVPALRLRSLARHHGRSLDPLTAWLAHVVMVFGAAITPSGAGGAPGLVAALARVGIPWGTSMGIAVQIFILDLLVFAFLVPLALAYALVSQTLVLPRPLEVLGLTAALAAAAGAVALGRYPRPVVKALLRLARFRALQRWHTRLLSGARSYYRSARSFAAMRLGGWTWLLSVTLLAWAANFALFWSLLLLYGAAVGFLDLMAVLSVVTLISFVVPSPGASGFVEVAAGLGVGVSAVATAAPLVLWRVGAFYVTYLMGSLCWHLLRRRGDAPLIERRRRPRQPPPP